MVNFILGRACTGKSSLMLRKAAAASVNSKTVIIVPEQFTFETERAMLRFNEANADNVSVLSFSRLYDAVTEASGRGAVSCVTECEKMLLISQAIKASVDNLSVFAKYVNNRELVKSIADVIRDLKFSCADSSTLTAAADTIGGVCGAKLSDLSVIMSVYDSLMADRVIDPADRLSRLYELLNDVEFFKGSQVYIDSFTGFTGQQYRIIERMIEQAQSVTFSFSTDDPDDMGYGVFYNTNSTIRKLKALASRVGAEVSDNTILNHPYYTSPNMSALEEFMSKGVTEGEVDASVLRVVSCANAREESLAAANIIGKEVCENGYRFKDFIVVARNVDDYAVHIDRQCANNNIACFRDSSTCLSNTLLARFIISFMKLSVSLNTDDIIGILKMGLIDVSYEMVSELENYTYMWDVKGTAWKDKWEMSVNGLVTEEDNEFDLKRLERINEARSSVISAVLSFKRSFAGTPSARIKVLYEQLIKLGVDNSLRRLCDKLADEGDAYNVSLMRQSWDCVINVLNSMSKVLPDTEISSDDFIDAFLIASDAVTISNVPQMLDEINFGSAERIRPSKPKISIILGANQGVFPRLTSSHGLFAPSDVEKLKNAGIDLRDDAIVSAVEENYLVYSMLCCPTDKVYLLYSRHTLGGDELEASAFVSALVGRFGNEMLSEFDLKAEGEFIPRTHKSAFSEIGSLSKSSFEIVRELLKTYPEYSDRLEVTEAVINTKDSSIDKTAAEKLFGNSVHISASKFDTYHRCRLSYLLKFGLRVKKLEKADLNVLQRGTIVHYVLENMIKKHKKKLGELSVQQISAEVDNLISSYVLSVSGSNMLVTARFSYLLDRITRSIKEIVIHLSEEFAQSDFNPDYCELQIGEGGELPRIEYLLSDGSKAYLDGKIDRVDVYKNNVRIVDYKTGRMSFVLSDTLVGLNMQMLLYLRAFIKNGGHLVQDPKPAGILYMPAGKGGASGSHRMNGLLCEDEEVVYAMEKENKGRFIPKKTAKSADFVDAEAFELIFNKIDALMQDMGNTVKKGEFCANPIDGAKIDACAYCDFASICRSSKLPHRQAPRLTTAQTIEILKEGEKSGV